MDGSNSRITVSPELVSEIQELLEDSVEYLCRAEYEAGNITSGETIYKIIECLAIAKQAEMHGMVIADD